MLHNSRLENSFHNTSLYSADVSCATTTAADFTRCNMTFLQDEDPGWKAAECLIDDFVESLEAYPLQHQLFDLLTQYEEICERETLILNKLSARLSGQTKFSRTVDVLKVIQKECSCWRLLRLLSVDRFNAELPENKAIASAAHASFASHKKVEEELCKKSKQFRELKLLASWCERNAAEALDDSNKEFFFAEKLFLWEHSLQRGRDALIRGVSHVTNMDPDAPLRKPLEMADKIDEDHFMQLLFAYVRSGQLQKGVDLCVHCGQAWRAAVIVGAELFDDPSYCDAAANDMDSSAEMTVCDPTGNGSRDIWKSIAWQNAIDPKLSVLERAIYGALSGYVPSILPVCTTWQDYLWAFSKAAAENLLDAHLRGSLACDLASLPASPFTQADLNVAEIFREIESCQNKKILEEAIDPYHVVEKFIVLGDGYSAICWLHSYLSSQESARSKHLLRFAVHLCLGFKLLNYSIDEQRANEIISMYIELLMTERRARSVATYCATLPESLQVELYSKFLIDVSERPEQVELLRIAHNVGLPVDDICKAVVALILSKTTTDSAETTLMMDRDSLPEWLESPDILPDDQLKSKAIDWLLFDQKLRPEAMRQANVLARRFLACRKHVATKALFERIPPDSVAVVTHSYQDCLPAFITNILHEYESVRTYLDAHESFVDWLRKYSEQKPQAPGDPLCGGDAAGRNFVDNVADEQRMKQYEADYRRWWHLTSLCAETALHQLKNVLLFSGGWMTDQTHDGVCDDRSRQHELGLIKKQCIPLVCSMMMKVYSSMEMYREAACLADILADENLKLFKHFGKSGLRELLQKFVSCSTASLDTKKDAFGYELN